MICSSLNNLFFIGPSAGEGDAARDIKTAKSALRGLDLKAALDGFTPVAILDGFIDQDLRATAMTTLALAGCDEREITSITGHELETIARIMKHYFGLHPELARRAIGKMQTYVYGAN